uniref:Uncharacterized protein n=1 Tax=Chelydra serpentina TaxID=8475 RepID=A0A8C3RYG0_CHESE
MGWYQLVINPYCALLCLSSKWWWKLTDCLSGGENIHLFFCLFAGACGTFCFCCLGCKVAKDMGECCCCGSSVAMRTLYRTRYRIPVFPGCTVPCLHCDIPSHPDYLIGLRLHFTFSLGTVNSCNCPQL